MQGKLILVPTPLDDETPLEPVAFEKLTLACKNQDIIALEEIKPGRRRWLSWGLPRIDNFLIYNEHTQNDLNLQLLQELKRGKNIYLLSDGGLPAFCDPGKALVDLCHRFKIIVTATPFCNSITLALALSGLVENRFYFAGFLPVERDSRVKSFRELQEVRDALVLMDTPYRLKRILEEMVEFFPTREIFVGIDLNFKTEQCIRGKAREILQKIENFKREFVIVISPL